MTMGNLERPSEQDAQHPPEAQFVTVFAITKKCSQSDGGPGASSWNEDHVMRMGPYGAGEYPPLFWTPSSAQAWLDSQVGLVYGAEIVPMKLFCI